MTGFQAVSVPSKKLWPLKHLQHATRNPHLPLEFFEHDYFEEILTIEQNQ